MITLFNSLRIKKIKNSSSRWTIFRGNLIFGFVNYWSNATLFNFTVKSPFRKHLSTPALIKTVFKEFVKIPDEAVFKRKPVISLTDHLMSGLAVFGLKCPSLLAHERVREETATYKNLKDLYRKQGSL